MPKPLTINLQINVYPDGSVAVSSSGNSTNSSAVVASPALSPTLGSTPSALESSPPTDGPSPAAENTTGSGNTGPSESDVRAAVLAAVKASDKATAVGVLERIAGVSRVPEVPADQRAAVIEALNEIVANAEKDPPAEA